MPVVLVGLGRFSRAIERGERNISLATLETLADALNTPPSTLLTDPTDHPD